MKQRYLLITIAVSLIAVAVVGFMGSSFSRGGQAQILPSPTSILPYDESPPTPTVAPLPTNSPRLSADVLFSDTFDTEASLEDWTFVDLADLLPSDRSVWIVQNGRLVQYRTENAGNPNTFETIAVTGEMSWANYTITADVYDQENTTFGLVARRQGDSFYRYRIIADKYEAKPKQVIEKVVNGVSTPLVEIDVPGYKQRRWYTVSLSVIGSTIQVTLNGEQVAEVTDATLTNGQAGLYTRAMGEVLFDDVVVNGP
jgi:hypothetical protein